MRMIQYLDGDGHRQVGVIHGDEVTAIAGAETIYGMARRALRERCSLGQIATASGRGPVESYGELSAAGCILEPLDHPDPAHLLISGTGLTHLGSASARNTMHLHATEDVTDSIRMFRSGLEGGKPPAGHIGAIPEWFYKGDGGVVARPGAPLRVPAFAEDGGEEPEIVGLYVVDDERVPWRIGFALGNEFSDHTMERRNYLLLAHSKLQMCSFGPELLLGDLPRDVVGCSRIYRGGRIFWEKEFHTGEDNMCHSLANLEHHHFKHEQFCRAGDAHVHFFGTATLSFADGVRTESGDMFEVAASDFGHPLRNTVEWEEGDSPICAVRSL
jgi:hypothetical protein